ncbi:MAG: hypothetical protein KAH01_05460 [Caldisericia bacterium]|nr:hypothetical protein [Caldisericia bacterium]
MNTKKLEQVVTAEAKNEATELIEAAKKDIKNKLESFMDDVKTAHNAEKQHLDDEINSRINNTKFFAESDYKKRLLHAQHDLLILLKKELLKKYILVVQKNPAILLNKVKKEIPKNANIYCSSELDKSISEKALIDQGLKQPNYSFKGVDSEIEPGLAFVDGNIKYIFPLDEIVEDFMQKNKNEIRKKIFDE